MIETAQDVCLIFSPHRVVICHANRFPLLVIYSDRITLLIDLTTESTRSGKGMAGYMTGWEMNETNVYSSYNQSGLGPCGPDRP